MATASASSKKTTTPKGLHMFAVTEEMLNEGVKRGGGRTPTRSKYHDEVGAAAQAPGTVYGILITDDVKATTIISQLRVAAKAHGVKLSVKLRDKAEKPFVGFSVVKDGEAE